MQDYFILERTTGYGNQPVDEPMRLINLKNQVECQSEQLIPRVVYSTIGNKKVKKKHLDAIEEFRSANTDYEFIVFDDDEAHDYLKFKFQGEKILDIFERSMFGPMRADILRVALMLFEGGVYIDVTKRLKKPLKETIHPDAKFIFSHEKNEIPSFYQVVTDQNILKNDRNLIVQWCMMSSPNNPIFETMIESIERDSSRYEKKIFENPKQAILELTATYQYTKAVWQHLLNGFADYIYAGFDFNEESYVLIPNSYSKNPLNRHYASKKHSAILKAKNEISI